MTTINLNDLQMVNGLRPGIFVNRGIASGQTVLNDRPPCLCDFEESAGTYDWLAAKMPASFWSALTMSLKGSEAERAAIIACLRYEVSPEVEIREADMGPNADALTLKLWDAYLRDEEGGLTHVQGWWPLSCLFLGRSIEIYGLVDDENVLLWSGLDPGEFDEEEPLRLLQRNNLNDLLLLTETTPTWDATGLEAGPREPLNTSNDQMLALRGLGYDFIGVLSRSFNATTGIELGLHRALSNDTSYVTQRMRLSPFRAQLLHEATTAGRVDTIVASIDHRTWELWCSRCEGAPENGPYRGLPDDLWAAYGTLCGCLGFGASANWVFGDTTQRVSIDMLIPGLLLVLKVLAAWPMPRALTHSERPVLTMFINTEGAYFVTNRDPTGESAARILTSILDNIGAIEVD